ncbi:MAG: NRDE family protein [Chitinophagaceae bacterium]
MCTVSFIRVGEKVFLASNRDEKHFRSSAIPPAMYEYETGKLLFPKDADAGGTWIAMHENGNAIIFLNGAFISHLPEPPYRLSRGVILLELITHSSPFQQFLQLNLNSIEPFTAVIWEADRLFETRWDGKQKHTLELDTKKPHIWSSATLYSEEVISRRKSWFSQWQQQNPEPSLDDILHFHQFTGDGDSFNDLMMNRNGQVYTVSITGIELRENSGLMKYIDLKNKLHYTEEINFRKFTLCK